MAASSSEFSCRIVDIDYYLAAPARSLDVCYSTFSGSTIDRVPVVRVFGATPCGQKCCTHVHGQLGGDALQAGLRCPTGVGIDVVIFAEAIYC